MIITPSRERFLKAHFFEQSFDEKEPDFELFKTLNSKEQYFVATHHNWDDGVSLFHWIIDSPKCDKGTASLIFWASEPDYYLEKSPEKLDEEEKDIYDLLQKIIQKFNQKEFKHGVLKHDPRSRLEGFDGDLDALPKALIRPTFGYVPFCISNISYLINHIKKQFSPRQRKRNAKRKNRARY